MEPTVGMSQSVMNYFDLFSSCSLGFHVSNEYFEGRDQDHGCSFLLTPSHSTKQRAGQRRGPQFLMRKFECLILMGEDIKEETYKRWKKWCQTVKPLTSLVPHCTMTCDIKITFPKVLISSPSHAWIGSERICSSSCFLFLRSWHCPYRTKAEHNGIGILPKQT